MLGIFSAGNEDFFSVHVPQIDEVVLVGERVLRNREKGVSVLVRFAEGCHQTPTRVGTAEVDAASRDAGNDFVTKGAGELWLAQNERLTAGVNLDECLPHGRVHGLVVARTLILSV